MNVLKARDIRAHSLQSCPTLRSHGLQPVSFLCPWDSPGKNTGVGCHFLLQGIFPTQESNPGLLRCRQILYQLSYEGSPIMYNGSIQIRYFRKVQSFYKNHHRLPQSHPNWIYNSGKIMCLLYKFSIKTNKPFCFYVNSGTATSHLRCIEDFKRLKHQFSKKKYPF